MKTSESPALTRQRAYRALTKDSYKAYHRNYYQQNKQAFVARAVARKYGITYEQYMQMIAAQDGKCAICGVSIVGHRACHVDHDHKSGKVRSLLCIGCNTGIGSFKESPEVMKKAIEYLARHMEEGK